MYQLFICNIIIIYIITLDIVLLLFVLLLFQNRIGSMDDFQNIKKKINTENHNVCLFRMKCDQSYRSMLIYRC